MSGETKIPREYDIQKIGDGYIFYKLLLKSLFNGMNLPLIAFPSSVSSKNSTSFFCSEQKKFIQSHPVPFSLKTDMNAGFKHTMNDV